jgi:hypothetical protein
MSTGGPITFEESPSSRRKTGDGARRVEMRDSIVINTPAAKAFDFLSDGNNDPLWRTEVDRMDVQGERQLGTLMIEYSSFFRFGHTVTPTQDQGAGVADEVRAGDAGHQPDQAQEHPHRGEDQRHPRAIHLRARLRPRSDEAGHACHPAAVARRRLVQPPHSALPPERQAGHRGALRPGASSLDKSAAITGTGTGLGRELALKPHQHRLTG